MLAMIPEALVRGATPTWRAKLNGVIALQPRVATGTAPPSGPAATHFYAFVNHQNFQVAFPDSAIGKAAYYYGRRQDIRRRAGPSSVLTGVVVA